MDRKLKIKVLNRLIDAGYDDEKKFLAFTMRDMLTCEIKGEEIGAVIGLQDAVKSHKLITYLAEEDAEEVATEEQNEATALGGNYYG